MNIMEKRILDCIEDATQNNETLEMRFLTLALKISMEEKMVFTKIIF